MSDRQISEGLSVFRETRPEPVLRDYRIAAYIYETSDSETFSFTSERPYEASVL